MSHSLSNYDFYKNQYNDAYLANPSCTTKKGETTESTFKVAEKQYTREHGKKFQKESIILMIKKDIFESALKKMELAVALFSIISDPDLSTILTIDEMNAINDILLYDTEFSKNLSASINKESTIHTNDSCKKIYDMSKFDHTICKALKIFQKYTNILCTKPWYKQISAPSALFLQRIRYFLEQYVLCRMYVTPEEAMNKELHYRKLWRSQKRCIEDVATFTAELKRQEIDHKKNLEDVIKRYKKNITTIDEIGRKCSEDITNTTIKYEKSQLNLYKMWEHEQREIQSTMENVTDDLKSLKTANTNLEQAIYKRKLTIESKLLAIITKYDTEIGSRHQMLQELNETYEYDKLEKQVLEKELEQQQKILATCIEQKEEAEMKFS